MDEHERFIDLIRDAAVTFEPELPLLPAEWENPEFSSSGQTYKALLFDVYGTLFCSAAGDIAVMQGAENADTAAVDKLARLYDPGLSGQELRNFFNRKVSGIHAQLRAHTQWPEVQADRIWTEFLQERSLQGSGRELALRYELAVNPVFPMPGAAQTIAALSSAACILGIISNAQFYTPLLFEAFLGGKPAALGFDPELIIYSFEFSQAKPSPLLFETAAARLKSRGIKAQDCAFVGNDMLSDIYGAMNAGFQGVLFAGDSRSLRLRQTDERLRGLRPSRIIRRLSELVFAP